MPHANKILTSCDARFLGADKAVQIRAQPRISVVFSNVPTDPATKPINLANNESEVENSNEPEDINSNSPTSSAADGLNYEQSTILADADTNSSCADVSEQTDRKSDSTDTNESTAGVGHVTEQRDNETSNASTVTQDPNYSSDSTETTTVSTRPATRSALVVHQ